MTTQRKKRNTKPKIVRATGNPTALQDPIVVDTSHMASKEEQEDNPLNRHFKTADDMTKFDDLEFQNNRLRSLLMTWIERIEFKGNWYFLLIDPQNRHVQMFDKDPLD